MKRLFLLGLVAILLVACNSTNTDDKQSEGVDEEQALKELNVEILTAEDAFAPGEEGKIEIQVTYGDEPVPDADEVVFEIWQHGSEDREKFEGIHEKDGKYYVTYTFEEGVYYAVPHVTARGLHTMPKLMLLVGDVEAPEEQEESNHHDHEHEEEHDEH